MVNINLLDWRGKRIQIMNHRFYTILSVFIICVASVMLSIDTVIGGYVSKQNAAIDFLTGQITQIENKIGEIKTLQEQKKLLLSRREVIEKLQSSRPFMVELFEDLATSVPDGVVLSEITRKAEHLSISGFSDSNYGVSVLMERLQRLSWVKDAKLEQISTEESTTPSNLDQFKEGSQAPTGPQIKFQLSLRIDTEKSADTGGNNVAPGH
jgi:type IV pilus assembly protein PilN